MAARVSDSAGDAHPPGLGLELSMAGETFGVGEPLYLLLRLKNISGKDLRASPLKVPSSDIGGNLGVVLSRHDGVREFHPPYDEAGEQSISSALEHLPILEPGQSWIIVVELLSYFSRKRALIPRPENRISIRDGTYDLRAFYRWDSRPGFVLRSETMKIRISRATLREKWRLWRTRRALRNRFDRSIREDPTQLCREAYSRGGRSSMTVDFVRAVLEEWLERDPLGTIGTFHLIEEVEQGPHLFLYDLITYKGSNSEEERIEGRRFLRELVTRWPDDYLGEVARQKQRFEEIAAGKVPSAERSAKRE